MQLSVSNKQNAVSCCLIFLWYYTTIAHMLINIAHMSIQIFWMKHYSTLCASIYCIYKNTAKILCFIFFSVICSLCSTYLNFSQHFVYIVFVTTCAVVYYHCTRMPRRAILYCYLLSWQQNCSMLQRNMSKQIVTNIFAFDAYSPTFSNMHNFF